MVKEFSSTGMWSLDVDTPVTVRLAAAFAFSAKTSLFIYAGENSSSNVPLFELERDSRF
jgi:hypothetical protein